MAAQLIHYILFGELSRTHVFWSDLDTGFWTFGQDLLDAPYSKSFTSLLHKCLAYDPDIRPRALEIVETCRPALDLYDHLESNRNDPGYSYNDLAGIARNEPPLGYATNEPGGTRQRGQLDEQPDHEVHETNRNSDDESDDDLLFPTAMREIDPNPPRWWE